MTFPGRAFFPLLLSVLFLGACGPEPLFTQIEDISTESWPSDKAVELNMEITDTLSYHDLYMHARNGPNYAFSNLFVFLRITTPTEEVVVDTIEMVLANPAGKWLGQRPWYAFEQKWTSTILFKRKIRFPEAGTYTLEMKQGMREEQLPDLQALGLSVVKTE